MGARSPERTPTHDPRAAVPTLAALSHLAQMFVPARRLAGCVQPSRTSALTVLARLP